MSGSNGSGTEKPLGTTRDTTCGSLARMTICLGTTIHCLERTKPVSDMLAMIERTKHAILTDGEEPRDLLIPEHLEPTMREAFGIHLYPQPVVWKSYSGLNIEWKSAATQLSIRTTKGDVRICK